MEEHEESKHRSVTVRLCIMTLTTLTSQEHTHTKVAANTGFEKHIQSDMHTQSCIGVCPSVADAAQPPPHDGDYG